MGTTENKINVLLNTKVNAAITTIINKSGITTEQKVGLLDELELAIKTKLDDTFIEEILDSAIHDLNNQGQIINNQKRMNELADYKYNKTLAYKNVIKRIVFSCIIIIGLTYAMNLPFFPSLFGKGLIILIIAYNIYYLIMDFVWNFRRDSKYWDKFNQITSDGLDADGNITLSKWDHNKRSLQKLSETPTCNIQY